MRHDKLRNTGQAKRSSKRRKHKSIYLLDTANRINAFKVCLNDKKMFFKIIFYIKMRLEL